MPLPMTHAAIEAWLREMKYRQLARTDSECARKLGVVPNTIVWMKAHGADRRTALACAALLNGLKPFGED